MNNPENQFKKYSECNDKELAKEKERHAKCSKTRKTNTRIKSIVQDGLREQLLKETKGSAYYNQFIKNALTEAKNNPSSQMGIYVMKSLFGDHNCLEDLDKSLDNLQNKDVDFMKYRISKGLFTEQLIPYLDDNSRYKIMICSRRAGKSYLMARVICKMASNPNSPVLYINRTFSQAINQIYDMIMDVIDNSGLEVSNASKADGMINFTNGSYITIKGNSDKSQADKLRGFKYRLVVIDEVGHQGNLSYLLDEVVRPAMMDFEDSQLILTGTPPRIPHTYVEKLWNEDKSYKHYHWTLADNPNLVNVDQEIQKICESKGIDIDSPFIQREYFGRIGIYDTEALVYKDYKTYEDVPVDFIPTNLVIGVDYGFVDYNSVVALAYNDKQGYVIDCRKWNKSDVSTIISTITDVFNKGNEFVIKRNPNYNIRKSMIVADSSDKSITNELYRNGLPAYDAIKTDKQMAINQLSEWCRTSVILIPANSVLSEEMELTLYKRDDTTDAILPEIDDTVFHPDALDALLYASRQFGNDTHMYTN